MVDIISFSQQKAARTYNLQTLTEGSDMSKIQIRGHDYKKVIFCQK